MSTPFTDKHERTGVPAVGASWVYADTCRELENGKEEWKRRHENAVNMLHAAEEERAKLTAEKARLLKACHGLPSMLRQAESHLQGKVSGTIFLAAYADEIEAATKGAA